MAALSKRAQLELQGWKFTPVPRFVPAGMLSDSRTGWVSSAYYDHKCPEAWVVAPPDALQLDERRFEGSSPNKAVSWAWGQAHAPQPDPGLSGVAALSALMQAAGSSGAVSDIRDQLWSCASRPDAELISACREYLGCDRIVSKMREASPGPWEDRPAFKAQMDRLSDAVREQIGSFPQLINLPAKTCEGVAIKARVIAVLFANTSGIRGAVVRSLAGDIAAVMGEQRS